MSKDNNIKDTKVTQTSEKELDFEKEMIEVDKAEEERSHTYTVDDKKRKNKVQMRRMITGGVFCFLALVGLLSIFSGLFNTGKTIISNDAEKEEYNKLLRPLVLYDPLPFETVEQADKDLIRYSSLWAAVMNEDMSTYETDEYGQVLLPATDVDKYVAKIFGKQITLTHETFSDPDEVEFVFNPEKQVYAIPTTSFPAGFTPKVEKIKKSFKKKVVTVGYVSPQKSWNDSQTGDVSKYVDYVFEKMDGQFCLVAIRESEMKVEAPVISPTPAPANNQPAV